MTVSLKHTFVSAIPDDADTSLVRPSDWNAEHVVTGDANATFGFDGSGNPSALTNTQLTAKINTFTDTLSGAVPLSGGGTTTFLRADGTFALPPGPEVLSADRTYYISTTGSNSNDGLTPGTPFLTIDHMRVVLETLDLNQHYIQVNLATGTYHEDVVLRSVLNPGNYFLSSVPAVSFIGNPSNPDDVVIQRLTTPLGAPVVNCEGLSAQYGFDGIKFYSALSGADGIQFFNGAIVVLGNVSFEVNNAIIAGVGAGSYLNLDGFNVDVHGSSATRLIYLSADSQCDFFPDVLTFHDEITFLVTAQVVLGSILEYFNYTSTSGTVHGKRFQVDNLAAISAFGAGLSAIPGDLPGIADPASGGFYDGIPFIEFDKGTVGSGTVTFNLASGAKQKLTVSGSLTIAFSGIAGGPAFIGIEIELVNGGAGTITWPTIHWILADGSTSTTFSAMGITLQASGTNWVTVWTTDGGTTLYGSVQTGPSIYTLPVATPSVLGGVKPDGTIITVSTAGAITVPIGTNTALGVLSGDNSTVTVTAGAVAVKYGTAANTAAQGNDSRITGAAPLASPTFTGTVTLPTGTTAAAPIKFVSGPVLAAAAAGAIEYDGTQLFFAPAASQRGSVTNEYYLRQHATYTLASAATVQHLFNGSTGGAITLSTGSYTFDCLFSLSSMSASSGNAAFSIANGTGTGGAYLMQWSAIDAVAGAAGAWQSGMSVTGATPAAMATATTATVLQASVYGSFEVTGAGTVIPSIQLANAALAVVAVGSYFVCHRIGDTTTVSMGNNV